MNWYKTRLRPQVRFRNPANDKRRAIWLWLAAEWGNRANRGFKEIQSWQKYDQSPKRPSNTNRGNWPPNQDDVILSTLRQWKRGQRLSYGEKIYLYSLLKIKKEDKRQLVQRFGISKGTLSNIQREISREAAPWITQKGLNTRQILQWGWINESIRQFSSETKYPYTARDVSTYLRRKHNIKIYPSTVRKIMKESLGLSFKLGKSRPVKYKETSIILMKSLFSIKISKILNNYETLINIDETIFSRSTKQTRSWSFKSEETNLMNICFSNSTSLITAITSFGDVFAANIWGSVRSERFVEYLNQLADFLGKKNGVWLKNWLIILDNVSIHRSSSIMKYITDKRLSMAFLPTYSPEMAPVKQYFSILKRIVLKQSSGTHINWKSEKFIDFLRRWMHLIQPSNVRSLWRTFTFELRNNLVTIDDLINSDENMTNSK